MDKLGLRDMLKEDTSSIGGDTTPADKTWPSAKNQTATSNLTRHDKKFIQNSIKLQS